MLFMILAGASVLGFVLTKMRIPHQIVELVVAMDIGTIGFLIARITSYNVCYTKLLRAAITHKKRRIPNTWSLR